MLPGVGLVFVIADYTAYEVT